MGVRCLLKVDDIWKQSVSVTLLFIDKTLIFRTDIDRLA